MRLVDGVALANREALPGVWLMRVAAPGIAASARPGQLVLVRPPGTSGGCLRSALPVHRLGRGELSFLFGAAEHGAESLARVRPADALALQGPLGRGFTVAPDSRHLLLVGHGTEVAPLVALADWAVGAGSAVTLLAGADTSGGLLPAAMLPAEVEYRVATSDGSLGHPGPVLDLLRPAGEVPLLLWADQVFASGPTWLYAGLRERIGATRTRREPGFAQGMVRGFVGCGAGACLGCAMETRDGTVYLCKAGPVVDLERMLL